MRSWGVLPTPFVFGIVHLSSAILHLFYCCIQSTELYQYSSLASRQRWSILHQCGSRRKCFHRRKMWFQTSKTVLMLSELFYSRMDDLYSIPDYHCGHWRRNWFWERLELKQVSTMLYLLSDSLIFWTALDMFLFLRGEPARTIAFNLSFDQKY